MPDDIRALTDFDRILHSPARLAVVAILAGIAEADFLYLLHETGLTKGNLSTHLSKLEESGYIQIVKTYQGKLPLTLCRLTAEGREAFDAYRKQMNQFLKSTE